MPETNTPAPQGRFNSVYSLKVINDKGMATIEIPEVIVRDQSAQSVNIALEGLCAGIMGPARTQNTQPK